MKQINNKFKFTFSSIISSFLLVIGTYLMTRNALLSFIALFISLSSNFIFGYLLQKEYSKYEEHKDYYSRLKDLLNNGINASKEKEKKKNSCKIEFEEIIDNKINEFEKEKKKIDFFLNITNVVVGLIYVVLGVLFFLYPTIFNNFKTLRGNLIILIIIFLLYVFSLYISFYLQKIYIQNYLLTNEKGE